MPRAVTTNQVVSLDHKEVRSEKKKKSFIVWMSFVHLLWLKLSRIRSPKQYSKPKINAGWSKDQEFPVMGFSVTMMGSIRTQLTGFLYSPSYEGSRF